MEERELHAAGGSAERGARVWSALCVTGGWVLFDLALYGTGPEPHLALALLPGSAVALLGAAAVGALWAAWPRALVVLVLGALVAAALTTVLGEDLAVHLRWSPRVAALQLVALLAVARVPGPAARRSSLAAAGGVLGATLVHAWRVGTPPPGALVLLGAAVLLVLVTSARSDRVRRSGALAVALALVVAWSQLATRATALRRADLPPPPNEAPPGGRPNLLLVVLDTVRADRLAPYGHERATTPALDAFVEASAVRYTQARSTSSWTLPSHASLFTGLFPDEHGATRPRVEPDQRTLTLQAWPAQRLRPDVDTLAERLRAVGYQTAALLGNVSFLRHEYGLDRGFERYDDRTSAWMPDALTLAQLGGGLPRVGFLPYREARTIADLALSWLERERRDGPFFLVLNFMDAHAPYVPPAPHDRAFGGPMPADPRRPPRELQPLLYDRELRYVDHQLARVLDRLEELELLDDTVVVVTSDHGEAFGEHDVWLHGWDLHEEQVRVPLYLKPAGRGRTGVRDEPVTSADVFHLALAELGLQREPARPTDGTIGQLYLTDYLRERWRERGVDRLEASQLAWVADGVKVMVGDSGAVQAYDLTADPREQRPLAWTPEELEAARARARAWWADHPPITTRVPDVDEQELERLRDLGYAGDE